MRQEYQAAANSLPFPNAALNNAAFEFYPCVSCSQNTPSVQTELSFLYRLYQTPHPISSLSYATDESFSTSLYFPVDFQMEEWNKMVRILKDESMEPNKTAELSDRIFQDLKRMKIKDKKKFVQRLGPEFENWALKLEDDYPSYIVTNILNDDDFWMLTLKVSRNL